MEENQPKNFKIKSKSSSFLESKTKKSKPSSKKSKWPKKENNYKKTATIRSVREVLISKGRKTTCPLKK